MSFTSLPIIQPTCVAGSWQRRQARFITGEGFGKGVWWRVVQNYMNYRSFIMPPLGYGVGIGLT